MSDARQSSHEAASTSVSARRNSPLLAAHFFGTFRVTIAGTAVDTWSSRRTRIVLAYLIAHNHSPIRRDRLMEVFWPGANPDVARNRLHVASNGIRQSIRAATPERVIERRFDMYLISDDIELWTDVAQFEANFAAGAQADLAGDRNAAVQGYEAACQLYQDDFLADDPYVDWTTAPREVLRLQAVEAQRRLMASYVERTNYAAAAILGRRILEMDPCNEEVH